MKEIAMLVMAMLLLACAPQSDEITIGAVLPLTGGGSYWGSHSQNGIAMAVTDINSRGGIEGKQLKVIYEDGQCDPTTALTATQKLVNIDGADIIIGEVCSSASQAMADWLETQEKLMITPCSEAPGISEGRDFVFRTTTPTPKMAEALAQEVKDSGHDKAAVLVLNNDFGVSIANSFKESFYMIGGTITGEEKYPGDTGDLRTEIRKLEKSDPDAYVLTGYPGDSVIAVKQLREMGINKPIFGGTGIASQSDFVEQLGNLAEGVTIIDFQDTTEKDFQKRYEQEHGSWPGITSCASLAYDDILLLEHAIGKSGEDPSSLKEELAKIRGFNGVSGDITFDEDGNLVRDFGVYIVRNREITEK